MQRVLPIFLLVLLFSCRETSEKKKTSIDSVTATIKPPPPPSPDSVYTLPKPLTTARLPKGIKFKGTLQTAWEWRDKKGDNILLTSYVAPYPEKRNSENGEDGMTAELHAFHFVKKDTGYRLLWKLSDAVRACPFDITAAFLKDTLTDLDLDGIAETTIQYKLSCRSDVSPDNMKLIMYEDTVKYSLRGLMCDPGSPANNPCVTLADLNLEKQPPPKRDGEEYFRLFGRYETEKEFAKAPRAFLTFAKKQWLKYVGEGIQ